MIDPARCGCACPSDKPHTIARPTPELGDMCSECTALNRIKMTGAPPNPDGCCAIGSKVTSGICKVCTPPCSTPGSFIPETCTCCTPERTLANNTCCKSTEYNSLEHCCLKSTSAWATKSNKCCITGKIADDTECCAQVLDAGHCCPTGNKWATVSSECCPTAKLLTSGLSSGLCCDGETPYKHSSSVCRECSLASRTKQVGSKEADGCCVTGQVVSNGKCCPSNKPYNVNGVCSVCNALNRTKKTGAPEPDGCCQNGATVINGQCSCPTSSPFTVDNKCSVCNAPNRVLAAGSKQPDKCCPDSTPYVLKNGTCSDTSCTFMFHIDVTEGGEKDSVIDGTHTRPQCLDTIITASRAKAYPTVSYNNFTADAHDNFVAEDIYKKLAASNTNITGEIKYFETSNVFLSDLKIYFDQECKPRPPTTAALTCDVGSYVYGQSPVALLWEPSFRVEDLAKNVALVSFPIDPKHADKLVEWKASSAAPLLVYDPSGEGKITSGYQLFGNWTFGPTKVASLAHSTVTNANANGDKLWENGFEALAQLDSDANGEVSADELEPLSLWFDDNRNGISENGEVRRLSAVGVRKLFYRGYEGNDAAHAIVLKVGFERERDGVLERGTMVDWFTESVSSELEYAQRALLSSVVKPVADLKIASLIPSGDIKPKTSRVIAGEVLVGRSESLALKKGAELARGVWKWSSKSKDIPVDGGFFVISDNQDGTIQGLTMIELPIDSSFGASSIVSVVGFKGTAKLEDSGKVSISFELNKEAGTDLQSSAELNGAGDSMSGSSHGTIKSEAANTEITYSWSAYKLK